MNRIDRRSLLLTPLAVAGATSVSRAADTGKARPERRNVMVYSKKGRFGGWPANFGIWSWGEEIACGFGAAYFVKTDPERHQRDRSRPIVPAIARSTDGGETWQVSEPASLLPPDQGGPPPSNLGEPMDFNAPGFALTLRSQDAHDRPSLFWYSVDKARTWRGPYRFPTFGRKGLSARTDYLVLGKHEALVFVTAAKTNGQEGHSLCVHTSDGGITWNLRSWIGKEPEGFSIMPSTVQLPGGRILAAVRVKQDSVTDWIELYASDDLGVTWREFARPVPFSGGKSGNPPSLIRMPGGRLCITWGYRGEPYGIRATVSDDNGKTWSPHIVLRDDGGAWDLGYTRDAVRRDGKLVTIYYWSPALYAEREIVATIWDPAGEHS
ncbi:MAG: exo-alpha-sialidase [Bryobacterales bacterium]|nr:exo-alpha-sialidase [Bryobacterales bacterium]